MNAGGSISVKESGLNYTGDPTNLEQLNLPLIGLDKALDEYIANEH